MNQPAPGVARRLFALLLGFASPLCADDKSTAYKEPPVSAADRQHWSFRPLTTIEVPPVALPDWDRNSIDRFIGAVLADRQLRPQPEAPRRTLIRRLSFDLVGLPPTPAEIDAFVAESDAAAYERLVDRLLTSPGYGERWAQHWLDLARFAETDGFEHDKTRPDAWKYRDWVITALNDDMPCDEFIRQQIAGDELYPHNESARIATRFCLSGPDMPDINLPEERRHTLLNELTSTVGEVVLGLQIGCAQCHDHKYDPISQADFYRLRAVFEPAVQLRKNKSVTALHEQFPYVAKSRMMLRGDFRRPGPEVVPGVLRVISNDSNTFRAQATDRTDGRRTALADWLVSRDNPLTARVLVNRVWQHHFGTGLVETTSDFGVMGTAPSHDRLLDWLANRFVGEGWNLRQLHRLIVTSATWRQQSFLPDGASAARRDRWMAAVDGDPDCRLLSRFPRRRLEGEVIRDAMLAAAGQLNRRAGGPGVRPPLPQELVGTLLKNQWNVTADTSEHSRRSIYVFARRNLRYPIFEVFDRPSANASCAGRGVSTTAPQSLHLLNSQFSLRTSRHLATLIVAADSDRPSQIASAFQRILGRNPTEFELADVSRLMAEPRQNADDGVDALTHLCLSLFNTNEFIFVD